MARLQLELWEMQSTPSLSSLPGPLWPRVVAPGSQIEQNYVLRLNWIVWNRTVKYKNGYGINNLQWFMCHKTNTNQSYPIYPTPPLGQDMTQGLTGLNSEFSFS